MSTLSKLFQPIRVGAAQLQHRVVMSPMTRNRATADHIPTDLMVKYYDQRSSTPGTLLITEATFIADKASGLGNVPGIWNQAQIDAWKKITQVVHDNGSFIYLQLWAIGRAAQPNLLAEKNLPYVSASDIKFKDSDVAPRPLTIPEIKEYVQLYGTAAANAIKAGFDGVEIHGANGYLIDQFIQTNTNTRTDEYGGSIENRIRFADEVVDAVVAAVGEERSAIRLSPWGVYQEMCMPDPLPTFDTLVKKLDAKYPGLAYIHVVDPDEYGVGAVAPGVVRSNDFVDAVRLPRPVIHAGFFNRESAIKAADAKEGVLVGFARSFISNPDLPRKLKDGLELAQPDYSKLYFGNHEGYTDYPFATEVKA
ncbi:hypothetical protein K488DRAFT_70890 [Vararia minispora EC-137]|uniref:Uncharacterized protein n=1 Tax=Vararia minispora EC-137 TaxID=1314806 RepID=A0ACB8QJZ0_9AGAM|nr:hypothetical protein K488DRAFT_70890 [Vararia minispora EC-137]